MGVFPSGQRGQTVNLLALPSVVRIHPLPPKQRTTQTGGSLFWLVLVWMRTTGPVEAAAAPRQAMRTARVSSTLEMPKPFATAGRAGWRRVSTRSHQKKTIAKAIVFFSYIRLRWVILLRSDIRLAPSDIALRAVFKANIISLKPQVSISLSQRKNITPPR